MGYHFSTRTNIFFPFRLNLDSRAFFSKKTLSLFNGFLQNSPIFDKEPCRSLSNKKRDTDNRKVVCVS